MLIYFWVVLVISSAGFLEDLLGCSAICIISDSYHIVNILKCMCSQNKVINSLPVDYFISGRLLHYRSIYYITNRVHPLSLYYRIRAGVEIGRVTAAGERIHVIELFIAAAFRDLATFASRRDGQVVRCMTVVKQMSKAQLYYSRNGIDICLHDTNIEG